MALISVRVPDRVKEAMRGEAQRRGMTLNAFAGLLFWKWYSEERSK